MKLKTKSGTIIDIGKHEGLQKITRDDVLELKELHKKVLEANKKFIREFFSLK